MHHFSEYVDCHGKWDCHSALCCFTCGVCEYICDLSTIKNVVKKHNCFSWQLLEMGGQQQRVHGTLTTVQPMWNLLCINLTLL
jgi:hypothetical protein